MKMLDFIAKLIGASARVGGAVALAALAVYFLRRNDVEPVTKLDPALYGAVIVAGIIGVCVVFVELLVVVGKATSIVFSQRRRLAKERKTKRITAHKNLMALLPEYTQTLLFLKANNAQRFPSPAANQLLMQCARRVCWKSTIPTMGNRP